MMARQTRARLDGGLGRAANVLALGALAAALAVTGLRAARHANDFAEAHWLLDYRFGFIRRGLAGEVLRAPSGVGLDLRTVEALSWITYGLFAVFGAAVLAVCLRLLVRLDWNRHAVLIAATFVTSPFIVTHSHLMGYLDQVVYLLAFGAVWAALRGHTWLAGVAVAIGVLVHENALLVALPPVALAIASSGVPAASRRAAWKRYEPLLVPVAAFAALALAEALFIDRRALRGLLQAHLERYPFVAGDMHIFVPEWLTTSLTGNFSGQSRRFVSRLTEGPVVLAVLPAVQAALFGAFAWLDPARRRTIGPAVAAVTLAPLLLHLSAWDTARLWSYTIGGAFLAFWIVAERTHRPPAGALALTPVVALPVLFINVAGRIPLLDHMVERFTGPTLLWLYAPAALGLAGFWVLRERVNGGSRD